MRSRRMMNQINVVPYIDVMLVLLVIFMVTAPMIQAGSVALPSVGESSTPPVAPFEVIVKADTSLAVHDRASTVGERAVTRTELISLLRQAQARNTQQAVLIAADKSVKYEEVLKVMDELQRLRMAKIGLLVQPATQ